MWLSKTIPSLLAAAEVEEDFHNCHNYYLVFVCFRFVFGLFYCFWFSFRLFLGFYIAFGFFFFFLILFCLFLGVFIVFGSVLFFKNFSYFWFVFDPCKKQECWGIKNRGGQHVFLK